MQAFYYYQHERRERAESPRDRGIVNLPMPPRADHKFAWTQVYAYLEGRGLSTHVAAENGWYPSEHANDRYLRLVIPATNSRRYNYWQARAVDPDVKIRYQSPRCPRTDSIIIVYPVPSKHKHKHGADTVIVAEGPMDALAAAELGFRAVALMGNQPSAAVLDFLVKEVPARAYRIVSDSDAPAAAAVIAQYLTIEHSVCAHTLLTYPHKDLAAAPYAYRKALLT